MNKAAQKLREISTLDSLVTFLRDEMGWPIETDNFEDVVFEYSAAELGIDDASAAKIESIRRLQPLTVGQPWGVFFVEFEPRKLPVTALRRILNEVVTKKRATKADQATWDMEDLMFISSVGEGNDRAINFAHFNQGENGRLPSLKVIAWDSNDTPLHMEDVADKLTEKLAWPTDDEDTDTWQQAWSSAFTLRHNEVITTSKALSSELAKLARNIRDRILDTIAIETDQGPVTALMASFRDTLVHDLTSDDFADMYAQTIAYGLLSARIVDPKAGSTDRQHLPVTNPFIGELMGELLDVESGERSDTSGRIDFDELGVNEVIDLLDQANLEAVVIDFGNLNPDEDPVIHFYESFLAEYDPKVRMQTRCLLHPRPVVSYIVRSVDAALRSHFGLQDGLADTTTWGQLAASHDDIAIPAGVAAADAFVQVLDPATGTGTFLVEVIDVVYRTLTLRWTAEGKNRSEIATLWNEYVPVSLLPRLFGYELLMAPYAIAHLKVGLKLLETGYRFGSSERANIYLTNALEPAVERAGQLDYILPALAHEAQAVNEVKQTQRFTVVLGNPPYSTISQNMASPLAQSVREYLLVDGEEIQERSNRNHLQDDYIKFIRFAQEETGRTGVGVVGLITNSSFLTGSWYRGMRYHLISNYAHLDITDLHGGTGFIRSAGDDDKNVFDIMQSVAVSVMTRTESLGSHISYCEVIGSRATKTGFLMGPSPERAPLAPNPQNQWLLSPINETLRASWATGWGLDEVFIDWGAGVKTNRNGLAIAFTEIELLSRMETFVDPQVPTEELENQYRFKSNYQWSTDRARRRLSELGISAKAIRKYLFRPFDQRLVYWDSQIVFNMRGGKMNVFSEQEPAVALLFSRSTSKDTYTNAFVSTVIPDHDCLERTKVAPIRRSQTSTRPTID